MPAADCLLNTGNNDEKPATESEGENGTAEEVQPGNGQGKVILLFLVMLIHRLSDLFSMSRSDTQEWR